MAQQQQNPNPTTSSMTNPATDSQVVIIEEKITNALGEPSVKKYSRGKFLGKGGFAKCYELTHLDSKKITAAKIVPKSTLQKSRQRAKLQSEIKIHRSLNHPNIVRFEHVFEDGENVYIQLELCTNQSLNELLKRRRRLMEIETQSYVFALANGMKYLHQNKIIHRDLKLGNLFLSSKMEIKIGDFGLAAKLEFESEKRHTVCGTPNYIAPEILENRSGHSYEVDIWSLGVIIYTLNVGKPPFETPDVKSTYKKIKMGAFSYPEHMPISENVKDVINKTLCLDPSKRLKLDEILAHPFLNFGNNLPKFQPLSTLACPPSGNYLKQYQSSTNKFSREDSASKLTLTDMSGKVPKQSTNDDIKRSSITKIKSTTSTVTTTLPKLGKDSQEIFVKKWVDYSTKYGLGYLQSNGSSGVFFNDCTKLVLDPSKEYFEYIERRASDKVDVVSTYLLKEYPKNLHKKITLLQHFRSYLEGIKSPVTNPVDEAQQHQPANGEHQIYQKKWMKTRHAIMFRLSNKIVQVDFQDKTQIMLSSENKLVTYNNKKGESSQYPIATALESENAEMAKRLKYTKEILTHMLNNNQAEKK